MNQPQKRQATTSVADADADSRVNKRARKKAQEQGRRHKINIAVASLATLTGCRESQHVEVLQHSVNMVKQFLQWQSQAVTEIDRLQGLALTGPVVQSSPVALPPTSCSVMSLTDGQIIDHGFLFEEILTCRGLAKPRHERKAPLHSFDVSSEKQLAKNRPIMRNLLATNQRFVRMRHKYSWRGCELLCDSTFTIFLDDRRLPVKGIWVDTPIKIARKLEETCDGVFCSLMCVGHEREIPASKTKPRNESELRAIDIVVECQNSQPELPRLEHMPPDKDEKPDSGPKPAFDDLQSFMSSVDTALPGVVEDPAVSSSSADFTSLGIDVEQLVQEMFPHPQPRQEEEDDQNVLSSALSPKSEQL